ncbi:hypothetical protein Rsub_10363 [Raphidocelis subcapitata]|uniref:Uncharacterized protein n=1 Tax=Raphidocelis subcapitata TaxID=307507 RepID=A0A2V0PHR2_9CHLO|nr:hypothetical protein Rsub_10363 [Raphidocelis subcapitata]|eukprot:GBF97440.1 hypothetical protein Rsub_10363 [Raphidocelis subcapitata]
MVSFLSRFAAVGPSSPVVAGDSTQSVRVLVVGEPNVGKTALSELIVTKKPSRPSKSTAGCAVSVALWEVDDGDAARGSAAPLPQGQQAQRFFVEIWDVSANPYYEQLRRSLYRGINGVVLVYDASDRASLRRLTKWASEVAAEGTFVAPLPDEAAARNIGGLPVPVLVVANKSDRARPGSRAGDASALWTLDATIARLCGGGVGNGGGGGGAFARVCGALRGWRGGGGGGASGGGLARPGSAAGFGQGAAGSAASLAQLESSVRSVAASAATGQLDWATVGAFFSALWARRYQPNTRSASFFIQDLAAPHGGGGNGGGAAAPGLAPAAHAAARRGEGDYDGDARVDDWV